MANVFTIRFSSSRKATTKYPGFFRFGQTRYSIDFALHNPIVEFIPGFSPAGHTMEKKSTLYSA
jgi:hypothetical protein